MGFDVEKKDYLFLLFDFSSRKKARKARKAKKTI